MKRLPLHAFLMFGITAAVVLFAFETGHGGQWPKRPNVVVIMADDLGYGDLSCYGNDWFQTPHLDELAAEGLRFTDFHSNGTVCTPTRAALVTGRYPHRAGLPGVVYAGFHSNRQHGLHPNIETTFAELIRVRGYRSGVFGKWHLGYMKQYNPVHHGFDRFVGFVSGNIDYQSHIDNTGVHDWWHGLENVEEEGYQTRLETDHAIEFIESHRAQPFVCYIPYGAPHWPYQGPEDKPVREQGNAGKLYDDRDPDHARPAYKAMVQSMDRQIGRLIAALKRLEIADRTLVFFCSDNGPTGPGRAGPFRGRKGSVWEGGHRVPAIAWWPGQIEPGTTTDQLALTMDLTPTILDLADMKGPDGLKLDGQSLVPLLLNGEPWSKPRTVFWDWPHRGNQAVRQGLWKLVLKEKDIDQPQLFHLAEDPEEQKDLAARYPERVQRLTERFQDWKREVTEEATEQPDEKLTPPEWLR